MIAADTMATTPINLNTLKAGCAACSMHQLCLPMGLEDADMDRLDRSSASAAGEAQITGFQMAGGEAGADVGRRRL